MHKQRSNIEMAEPLRYWRAKKGLSQARLAELANTSALTISQLESGKRKSRGKTLEKILAGFKLTENELAPTGAKAVESPTPTLAKKESTSLRLSNLDLELLNRILNLDFEAKLDTLRFLQNLS